MQQDNRRLARRKWLAGCVVVTATTIGLAPFVRGAAEPKLFQFENEARQHCPSDTVVWVNPKTGIFVFRSDQRWYGKTKPGFYVCQLEGKAAGYRAKKG
jgi:hypothetical protein